MFFDISPLFPIFLAMQLLAFPLNWLLAFCFAAGFHELCHVAVVCLSGGELLGFSLSVGGAVIHASIPGRLREILCIAAGPLGSLSLLFLLRFWPEAAVCGLAQGIGNLLPLPWTDGGRLLRFLPFFGNFPGKPFPKEKSLAKKGESRYNSTTIL